MPRKPKELKGVELKKILAMKPEDVTLSLLRTMFADTETSDAEYTPQDKLTLPKGRAFNKGQIRTNLGRFVVNMFVLAPLEGAVEYVNAPLTQKTVDGLISDATEKMTENEVTPEQYVDFMERLSWIGYSTVAFTSPSFGLDGVRVPPKTAALKKRLLKQHAKKIASGDPQTINRIEKELLESARKELKAKGSPSLEYYESGTRGSFDNNFKNMAVMRGLVPDPQNPGKFLVGKNNLSDGTGPEDQHLTSSLLIQGAGGRAIDTRKSGYMSKQLTSAFQGIVLGPPGSDCGAKRTLKVKLTQKNHKAFRLRYIMKGGKPVLLDMKTLKSMVGREVELRSPMFCRTPEVCEMCYGRLPFELGIKNVGLTYNAVGEKLKNLALKSFHDATVHLGEVDLDRAISAE